jgi:hypothetical protein
MTTTDYTLAKGAHNTPDDGRCAMEWVAYIAGEPHSDSPACVSPLLRDFGMSLNDRWDDEQRQKLRPYLARCIGTAGDGRDMERSSAEDRPWERELYVDLDQAVHACDEALRDLR